MAGIKIIDLKKSFQVEKRSLPVLTGVNLSVPGQQITVILGRSGCGKTTLLRLAGGLEKADSGQILYDEAGTGSSALSPCGRPENAGSEKPSPDASRRMAFVFQEPRLMPWLTVEGNIAFGLRPREKKERQEHIREIITTVGLQGFEKAYPSQLSGGMQQRAALARALAFRPSFIMMDEPFAALDYFTREQMQQELLRVQETEHCSILFVTHSIDEALLLADQIVILQQGTVKAQYQVTAPKRNRNLLDPEFISLKRSLLEQLNQ